MLPQLAGAGLVAARRDVAVSLVACACVCPAAKLLPQLPKTVNLRISHLKLIMCEVWCVMTCACCSATTARYSSSSSKPLADGRGGRAARRLEGGHRSGRTHALCPLLKLSHLPQVLACAQTPLHAVLPQLAGAGLVAARRDVAVSSVACACVCPAAKLLPQLPKTVNLRISHL